MSLKLSKTNAPAYGYYSEGDGSDPLVAAATLDQSGGTVAGDVITAYLVATGYLYMSIVVQPVNGEAGITWQVSLDNSTWAESVEPASMDARSADQVIPIYFRLQAANNNSLATGGYTAADISISALEVL